MTIGCWKFSLSLAYAIAQLVVFTMGSRINRTVEEDVEVEEDTLPEKSNKYKDRKTDNEQNTHLPNLKCSSRQQLPIAQSAYSRVSHCCSKRPIDNMEVKGCPCVTKANQPAAGNGPNQGSGLHGPQPGGPPAARRRPCGPEPCGTEMCPTTKTKCYAGGAPGAATRSAPLVGPDGERAVGFGPDGGHGVGPNDTPGADPHGAPGGGRNGGHGMGTDGRGGPGTGEFNDGRSGGTDNEGPSGKGYNDGRGGGTDNDDAGAFGKGYNDGRGGGPENYNPASNRYNDGRGGGPAAGGARADDGSYGAGPTAKGYKDGRGGGHYDNRGQGYGQKQEQAAIPEGKMVLCIAVALFAVGVATTISLGVAANELG